MDILLIILSVIAAFIVLVLVLMRLNFNRIIKLFEEHSVSVTGMKGTGKDLLFGNVIHRRKKAYVSNMDYGGKYHFLDYDKLDCGGNSYENFVNGDVQYYAWEYPVACDIYVSDCGVYFPSQYNAELNRRYKHFPTFMALSRQIAKVKVHTNQQNLTRVWDKIREHSDYYINCRKSIYFLGFVIQFVTLYDKAESCQARVQPCRVRVPLLNAQAKMQARTYIDNFFNTHGTVKNMTLFYRNKSKHDSYLFGNLMRRGGKRREKREDR